MDKISFILRTVLLFYFNKKVFLWTGIKELLPVFCIYIVTYGDNMI